MQRSTTASQAASFQSQSWPVRTFNLLRSLTMLDLVRDIDVQSTFEVRLVELSLLRRTERHNPPRASRLAINIAAEGKWSNPIWVEYSDLLIMDGHHRLEAAILLGLARLPCVLLS